MRIKNKTQLRKIVKSSIGNAGSLEMVEIYEDGSWDVMSQSTRSKDSVYRSSIGSIGCESWPGEKGGLDAAITADFREIENDFLG